MKVAIIGCGYVGTELAQKLCEKKHIVTATTLHPKDLSKIEKVSQKSFILEGSDENAIYEILKDNDVLILSLAANSSKDYESTYLKTVETLKTCANKLQTEKTIIYISRTKVYGDCNGQWVDESSSLKAKDEESQVLIKTENILLSLKDFGYKVLIFRSSNIYGPERDIPALFKSIYKQIIPGHGDYYTNMIHRDDVVNVILYSLENNLEGIFNLADDEHPTRKEFMDKIAQKLNVAKPEYDPKLADFEDYNKRVANYRIKEKGYNLIHPTRTI